MSEKAKKKMDSTPDLFLTCQADVDGCLTHSSQLLWLDHSAVALSSLRCLSGLVAQRDFQAGVIS